MSIPEPMVSVTCITFNHERFIAQAIEGPITSLVSASALPEKTTMSLL